MTYGTGRAAGGMPYGDRPWLRGTQIPVCTVLIRSETPSQVAPQGPQASDNFACQYLISLRSKFHRLGMVIPEIPTSHLMATAIAVPEVILSHGRGPFLCYIRTILAMHVDYVNATADRRASTRHAGWYAASLGPNRIGSISPPEGERKTSANQATECSASGAFPFIAGRNPVRSQSLAPPGWFRSTSESRSRIAGSQGAGRGTQQFAGSRHLRSSLLLHGRRPRPCFSPAHPQSADAMPVSNWPLKVGGGGSPAENVTRTDGQSLPLPDVSRPR
jgi:hypothetical protein